jgi:hypothetical protein
MEDQNIGKQWYRTNKKAILRTAINLITLVSIVIYAN